MRFCCVFIVFSILCLPMQHVFDLKYCKKKKKKKKISEILLLLKIMVSVNIL